MGRIQLHSRSWASGDGMDSSGPPPPGWYDDLGNAARLRWWTGAEWGPTLPPATNTSPTHQADALTPSPHGSKEDDARLLKPLGAEPPDATPNATSERALHQLLYQKLHNRLHEMSTAHPIRSRGWYPDPGDESRLRWWDGHDWNDNQAPDDLLEQAEPNQGEISAATKAKSQTAGTTISEKPLTTAEQQQPTQVQKNLASRESSLSVWGQVPLQRFAFGSPLWPPFSLSWQSMHGMTFCVDRRTTPVLFEVTAGNSRCSEPHGS